MAIVNKMDIGKLKDIGKLDIGKLYAEYGGIVLQQEILEAKRNNLREILSKNIKDRLEASEPKKEEKKDK